jgi:hypothetical protein
MSSYRWRVKWKKGSRDKDFWAELLSFFHFEEFSVTPDLLVSSNF